MNSAYLRSSIALCVALTLAAAAPAQQRSPRDAANQRSSPKVLAAFRSVVAKAAQGTVRIKCDGKETALGVVVKPDGWIITKASELKGQIIVHIKDGREVDARIVGIHENCDLAMLKVEVKGLMPLDFTESKVAPVGNWVATPGLEVDPLAIGVVSVAARKLPTRGFLAHPSTSGYLGVALAEEGKSTKVSEVLPNTGAAKAGLKVNDLILAVGDKAIADIEGFLAILGKHKPGETVHLRIKRDDKEMEVKATLGKRPAARADFQNQLGGELSQRRIGFPTVLQHDTVLKPKDCGGPLVDLDGKVIGINIARAGRTESYAIPSEEILPLLPNLMSGKLAPKGPTPAETKLGEAKTALENAEAEAAAAAKRLKEAEAAFRRAGRKRGPTIERRKRKLPIRRRRRSCGRRRTRRVWPRKSNGYL